MAVRGVYTEAEAAMLSEWRERAYDLVGWAGDPSTGRALGDCAHRVVTKELISHMANAYDPRNLLYSDDSYARNSRWGAVIAPPFYPRVVGESPSYWLNITPDVGVFGGMIIGEAWEFFKPVYVGDRFRLWNSLAKIEDVTRPGDQEERRFLVVGECRYVNQKDETVAVFRRTNLTSVLPQGAELGDVFRSGEEIVKEALGDLDKLGVRKGELRLNTTGEYVYTREEIEAIDRLYAAEERRGAMPLYWEDVVIGEELEAAVKGPITVWDAAVDFHGSYGNILTNNESRRLGVPEWNIIDPDTNVPHACIEHHLTQQAGELLGVYSSTISIGIIEGTMTRCISNWMGDDGFLRKFTWVKLLNTPLGDTIFARGKVARKYITDEGEHLVDLDVWLESVRGYVGNVGPATVRLLSKEQTFSNRGWGGGR